LFPRSLNKYNNKFLTKIIMKKNLSILIIAIIIAGGAGFYGGMIYGKQAAPKVATTAGANRAGFTGTARTGARTGVNGAGIVNGQILAKTDNSLTIKSATAGSQIVFLAPSTQIMQSSTTTINNLNVGQNVMVSGTTNSDGSVTARTVQVGDFRFGGPRPAGGQDQGGQGRPTTSSQNSPVSGQ
jgi:hypothetical protein